MTASPTPASAGPSPPCFRDPWALLRVILVILTGIGLMAVSTYAYQPLAPPYADSSCDFHPLEETEFQDHLKRFGPATASTIRGANFIRYHAIDQLCHLRLWAIAIKSVLIGCAISFFIIHFYFRHCLTIADGRVSGRTLQRGSGKKLVFDIPVADVLTVKRKWTLLKPTLRLTVRRPGNPRPSVLELSFMASAERINRAIEAEKQGCSGTGSAEDD